MKAFFKELEETMDMVKDLGVQVLGLVVSVDRMERGLTSELSAVEEVKRDFGVTVLELKQ